MLSISWPGPGKAMQCHTKRALAAQRPFSKPTMRSNYSVTALSTATVTPGLMVELSAIFFM
jgi:hypothetical protein